jgi:hypothetical protein
MADMKHWSDYVNNIGPLSADGLRHNNLFRKGNKAEMDKVWEFFQRNGRMPTEEEFKTRLGGGGGYNNIMKDMMGVVIPGVPGLNPEDVLIGGEPGKSFLDEYNLDQKGTMGNTLYNTFKQAGEIQYDQGKVGLQTAERDLGMNQAMDRQKFLDEIRNRRRVSLKTGLSSAQIANQEVQSLLMAQNKSNDNAMTFYNQRMGLQNQFAMNDVNARFGAWETLGGGMGANMGAAMAAGAGDANQVAINYGKSTAQNPMHSQWYDKATGTGK